MIESISTGWKVKHGENGKAQSHLAFAIQPPDTLVAEIRRLNGIACHAEQGCSPLRSPPHLTLLYMPCALLNIPALRHAILAVRNATPFSLRYAGVRASEYGTLQLEVRPIEVLRRLHIALLTAMGLDEYLSAPQDKVFDAFGTTNFGDAYSPHVTLGQCGTKNQANANLHWFSSLPEVEQPCSLVWVADASDQLKYHFPIKSRGKNHRDTFG
jgi:2'-5' RNA ligase